ncbi:MAG: hypothetical protein ACKO4R_04380 [Synechococcales cyanobacterium]
MVEKFAHQPWTRASWGDRLQDAITRWLRLPSI